jgi:hypothetical protein
MDAKTAAAIERLKSDPQFARKLLSSTDGQKLMSLLSGGDGGAALARATESAGRGSTRELAQMLTALMQNKDAAALMQRLNNAASK